VLTANYALFLSLALMLGGSYPLTEVGLRGFDPLSLVFVRLLVGACFLLAWELVRSRRLPRYHGTLPLLGAIGLLNTLGSFVLVTWGQKYVTASYTAILLSSNAIFAALGAAVVLPDERLTSRRGVGIAIGFVGVVALFANELGLGSSSGAETIFGALAILAGAVGLAVVAIAVRRRLSGLTPAEVALPMLFTGIVFVGLLLVALWMTGAARLQVDGGGIDAVSAALVLGVVNAGIGNLVYYRLIANWGVARTALVGYVVPFVGVGLGVAFLHDRIGLNMIVGFALITTSLFCLNPFVGRRRVAIAGTAPPADV
jgi:drug/metabolite transporter (DMT)-like permease